MEFGFDILILFFFIALAEALIHAIAGGGGLITIPALLALGLPPAVAIATNKVGAVGGSFSAALHFIRVKEISLQKTPDLADYVFPYFTYKNVDLSLNNSRRSLLVLVTQVD